VTFSATKELMETGIAGVLVGVGPGAACTSREVLGIGVPQVTATMLMAVVARAVGDDNLQWGGGGLRDTTRLASSPASMWTSVLASNQRELKPLINYLASELASFADHLDDPQQVAKIFDEANRARSSLK